VSEDEARLRKLAEAASINDVRIYIDDGGYVMLYRDRGTRQCIADGQTINETIDHMDLEI
jgi:hypothetical protein